MNGLTVIIIVFIRVQQYVSNKWEERKRFWRKVRWVEEEEEEEGGSGKRSPSKDDSLNYNNIQHCFTQYVCQRWEARERHWRRAWWVERRRAAALFRDLSLCIFTAIYCQPISPKHRKYICL